MAYQEAILMIRKQEMGILILVVFLVKRDTKHVPEKACIKQQQSIKGKHLKYGKRNCGEEDV